MKCRFPVAEVDGITIAVLPCKENDKCLGLLLHPALSDGTQHTSRRLYYVSWPFRERTGSGYKLSRLTYLVGKYPHLRFRRQSIAATWCDIYIAAHPLTTERRDGAYLLQGFLPDVAPSAFRIPRTLLQTLGVLTFFPRAMRVSWDSASKDTMWFQCHSMDLEERVCISLGI